MPMRLQVSKVLEVFDEINESPKLMEWQLDGAPPPSGISHKVGM